jgi:hypothetical protein
MNLSDLAQYIGDEENAKQALRELGILNKYAIYPFCGEIEIDKSYFGGRIKENRGHGAAGKVPVFGMLDLPLM